MLCALALLVALIATCVYAWPKFRRAEAPPPPPPAPVPSGRVPQTLEGELLRQLMTGGITRTQYRNAMVTLAVRDNERHPLRVPPDVGPPAGA